LASAALTAGALLAVAGAAAGSSTTAAWTFVSAPGLHPPKLEVLVRRAGLARGDFLVTGDTGLITSGKHRTQVGPLILDSHARPVWFLPRDRVAFGLEQQRYEGRPVLVWVEGALESGPRGGAPRGAKSGQFVVYNEDYRRIATIQSRVPWMTDLHDASIVGPNIWITVSRVVSHQHLSPYGGPHDGTVLDVGLQEFNVSTGRLIRTWDALNPGGTPNVPLSASKERTSPGWDAYHLNSVQALANGDLLVSMRNTWAVYLIDPITDRTLWTLGGKRSTFKLPPDARFAWQHDARLVGPRQGGQGADVELTLFDDNSSRGPAKGMILRLNTVTRRATLVHAYPHHPPYTAQVLGSMQLLPNGNALVDWGAPDPYFTEFSSSGKQLLNVVWPLREQSYRTLFTNSWVGTPYYPPSGAVRGKTIYASWNGATRVSSWEVMAGPSISNLRVVASHARTGFETAITLSQTHRVYQIRALTATGKLLRASRTFS
jgi:hypothetical protein